MEEIKLKLKEGFLLGTGAIISYNFYLAVNDYLFKIVKYFIEIMSK